MRVAMAALGCMVVGSVLIGGSAAFGAGMPAGGPVTIHVTPSPDGIHGPIVITGAIGDHGQTTSIDKNGKPDANGNFVRITLKKGTFEVNSTALNAKTAKAQPTVNRSTCSFDFTGTGPVTLFNGTGLYAGISGTLSITITFAGVGPLYTSGKHKGQCNSERQRAAGCAVLVDQRQRRRQVRMDCKAGEPTGAALTQRSPRRPFRKAAALRRRRG